MATLCITTHAQDDPIAQALMRMPNGGPQVRIKVGREDYRLHHWTIRTAEATDHLIVAWQRWQDIQWMPPLTPWQRIRIRLRRITRP